MSITRTLRDMTGATLGSVARSIERIREIAEKLSDESARELALDLQDALENIADALDALRHEQEATDRAIESMEDRIDP